MRVFSSLEQNKVKYKNYLLLLGITLLAYWPLTFGIFSVKNDAIHYFLPYRFQISETLRNGEWPLWNPYIYLGYPVQGDMQSGAWNPIVWVFSFISRYDLTLFHFENLLYIFLGGIGMYKLTNRLVSHSNTALLIAVSYMLSGFMLGGQLINWLAAAAFLPFVIHYYLQTIQYGSYSYAIKTGIAFYLLFIAGYPSFVIITGYILLFLFIITVINRTRNKESDSIKWKHFILQHFLILLIFAGLSLPAIVSYAELLPYYQRGSGTSYQSSITNSFEWKHLLSLVFPTTISANDVSTSTDLTCRNIYSGIFTLIFLTTFPPKLNRRNILLISLALFAFLFSLGDATPFQQICYNLLPGMNTFRHPSQMRLFLILSILLLSAPGLKKLLSTQLHKIELDNLKKITWAVTGIIMLVTIIALTQSSILKNIFVLNFSQFRIALKSVLDSISLSDAVVISGFVQLFFLVIFLILLRKSIFPKKLFCCLWIFNMFIMAQFVLPITFVSKTSPKEINAFIHAAPKGFPVSGLENAIADNSSDALNYFDKIALSYFYNKKIGISHVTNSPSFLAEQADFIDNNFLYRYVSSMPVAYFADSLIQIKDSTVLNYNIGCRYAFTDIENDIDGSCSSDNKVSIKKLSANSFEMETQNLTNGFLALTQNYHHNWLAIIDGKKTIIHKTNMSFMGINIPAGKHTIVFRFVPGNTIKAIWVMLTTLLLLIMVWIVSLFRQKGINRL